MKILALSAAMLAPFGMVACAEQPTCPVSFVAEEVDTGTAQRVTVSLESALEADVRFSFVDAPSAGGATFVLKRAALTDRKSDEIELIYEVTDEKQGLGTRRVANCGSSGADCMTAVLADLLEQCVAGG